MLPIRNAIKQIRGNIVTGILLLIPSVTTIYVFVKLFGFFDSILPNLFNSIIPVISKNWIPGVGLILILICAYFVGVGAKNYFGRMIIDTGNAIISSIPLLNKIYLAVQQIIDSITSNKKNLFEKAVLVEYPKEDSFCIGFITSHITGEIPEKTHQEIVSIFIPTTPNPTSGFLLFLPKSHIIELDMSVETALKTVMSFGLISTEQFKKTNHLYKLPGQLKKWNWMKSLKKNLKTSDPRD